METLTLITQNPTTFKLSGDGELEFTDGREWLEVRCDSCGRIGYGDQDEVAAAEALQVQHSDNLRGHRVTIDLFFRECVSTRLNKTPKDADDNLDFQVDRN